MLLNVFSLFFTKLPIIKHVHKYKQDVFSVLFVMVRNEWTVSPLGFAPQHMKLEVEDVCLRCKTLMFISAVNL